MPVTIENFSFQSVAWKP